MKEEKLLNITYERIPLLSGIHNVTGIVNGKIEVVPYNPSVLYRAENDENLIYLEAFNFRDIVRKIGMNYSNHIFKIFKVYKGVKSEKFYYYYDQRIYTIGDENFVIIEIPEINKTYSLKEPTNEILNTFYEDHSKYELHVSFYEDGELTSKNVVKRKEENYVKSY